MLTVKAVSAVLSVIVVIGPPAGDAEPAPVAAPPTASVPGLPGGGVPAAGHGSAAGTPTSADAVSTATSLPRLGRCTTQADSAQALTQALSSAAPGSRICVTGDLSASRLEIGKGGSEGKPVAVTGGGKTKVKGITIEADHVVVDGFVVPPGAEAPGIEMTGNGITVSNNHVDHPTGGDSDGIRFFGDNNKILHNTITNINPGGGGAHADCMQTFTSGGGPPTNHLVVNGNRCERIDNQCLMAEGPGDVGDGGGGPGKSSDWLISNNYCDFGAGQALMIEAVQDVTIRNNEFKGTADKAIGLDIKSTGATVRANKLLGVKAAVGMSEDSRQGYQGPDPQGGP